MQNLGAVNDRGTVDSIIRRFQLDPGYNLFNISPEIEVGVSLGEFPELLYHMGWRRYAVTFNQPAVAAQVSMGQLRAAVQGVMVVVEKVIVSYTAATEMVMALGGAPDFATTYAAKALDFRNPAGATAIVSSTTNAVELTASLDRQAILASTPSSFNVMPVILTTVNNALAWDIRVVNTALDCTVVWRERRMNDQENTL